MKRKYLENIWIPIAFILLSLFFLPIYRFGLLTNMPGDIGDARLNNYFLENVFQFFYGHSDSLWHLPFFYPFPYVLGFSDNLFGTAPVYLLARIITGQSDTAYQIWFLCGYIANFSAAYYVFRRLGGSPLASSVGALVFTFALPTTAHAGHAQLHYRFGLPLTIVFLVEFLISKKWNSLVVAGAWLVWQFYSGIYMGFFTLLLLAAMIVNYLGYEIIRRKVKPRQLVDVFVKGWKLQTGFKKITVVGEICFLLLMMIVLFYPYWQVSHLYGFERQWSEIATMLPRPQSYFLSDASYLWSASDSKIFSGIPMRHEHQMFIGLMPLILAGVGLFFCYRSNDRQVCMLMLGMSLVVIVLTLNINGLSLWYFIHRFPLASAIRVLTRLDQAFLFPVGYFVVMAIDQFITWRAWGEKIILLVVLPLLVIEFAATSMYTSSKEVWRQRLFVAESRFPKKLPNDAIVFFAQGKGPFYADELDAMWVCLNHGVKTINGYSGSFPQGYSGDYGRDCSELPKRVISYLAFNGKANNRDAYFELIKRVVPIGFMACNDNWQTTMPNITIANHVYSADKFRHLSYYFAHKQLSNIGFSIDLIINNLGETPFSALSAIGKPIRISWRFLDKHGIPTSGWDTRKDLPFDIPPNGSLTVHITIDPKSVVKDGTLQASLVQESVFWAHDLGIPPATVFLNYYYNNLRLGE